MALRGWVAVGLAVALCAPACSGDDGAGALRIPPTTERVRASEWRVVPLEGRPSAAAVTEDGWLSVVDDELGEVQFAPLVPDAPTPSSVAVGGQLVGISFGAVGVWAIDATGTALRVLAPDPADRPRVELGGTLVDVVAAGDAVYVGDLEHATVDELDAATGARRRTIAVPAGVVRLAVDGDRLWVTGTEHGVTPIDLGAGVAGPSAEVGNGPIGVAVAGGVVWVANGDDGTVSRLDAATGDRLGPDLVVGDGPTAIDIDGPDVWVLNQDSGTVSHLRTADGHRVEPDIRFPNELTRVRDLIATPAGVAVVGVDAPSAAFLARR